jgi:UDP-N-acetylmuramoylalanine--D-glutamate ligase
VTLNDYVASVKNKKVAVIGMGVSNTPLIRLLLESGVSVTVCDKSTKEKLGPAADEFASLGAAFKLGEDYLKSLDCDLIFKTPGLRPDVPELLEAKARGAEIVSEMEIFYDLCPCPIIAVTGSDGKTTTTTIIAKLLEKAGFTVHLGGNIGNPLLCETDSIRPGDYAVTELSSFQLMTMKKSANIAVITNISPNHLDYHRDMEEYTQAKLNVYKYQSEGDFVVLNADNAVCAGLCSSVPAGLRTFSRKAKPEKGCWFDGNAIIYTDETGSREIIKRSEIKLPGLHNVENYMAAFSAVIDIVGDEVCRELAKEFGGVEHRIELVREKDGVKYYNDSIASSPTRSIAGLNSFSKKLIMIAGGYDKHLSYDVIGPVICDKVKKLVLVGATSEKIKNAVLSTDCAEKPEIFEFTDFEKAVRCASDIAAPGDVVILSPASASFDMFKNFAERGKRFKDIVNSL